MEQLAGSLLCRACVASTEQTLLQQGSCMLLCQLTSSSRLRPLLFCLDSSCCCRRACSEYLHSTTQAPCCLDTLCACYAHVDMRQGAQLSVGAIMGSQQQRLSGLVVRPAEPGCVHVLQDTSARRSCQHTCLPGAAG